MLVGLVWCGVYDFVVEVCFDYVGLCECFDWVCEWIVVEDCEVCVFVCFE